MANRSLLFIQIASPNHTGYQTYLSCCGSSPSSSPITDMTTNIAIAKTTIARLPTTQLPMSIGSRYQTKCCSKRECQNKAMTETVYNWLRLKRKASSHSHIPLTVKWLLCRPVGVITPTGRLSRN